MFQEESSQLVQGLAEVIAKTLTGLPAVRQSTTNQEPAFMLGTDVGVIRNENQDRVAVIDVSRHSDHGRSFICAAVSDGMGGMIAGDECATNTLAYFFAALSISSADRFEESLTRATIQANVEVHRRFKGKGGATLSAVLVDETGAAWFVNVGDSRIYAVLQGGYTLDRVTVDDTLEEAFGGQGRELVQFIGIGSPLLPRVGRLPADADEVFITSDGAHYFSHELLSELVLKAGDPRRAADRIIALSRWLGGPDNASIAAFRIGDFASHRASINGAIRVWGPSPQARTVIYPLVVRQSRAQIASEMPAPTVAGASSKDRYSKKRRSKKPAERTAPKPILDVQPELLVTVTTDEVSGGDNS